MHLLLLHGAVGAADQLKPLSGELERDFTVHAMDFPGHGSRPLAGSPYSISLFAEDVLRYLDNAQLEQVSIFGYSMGGYVGMYLARYHRHRIQKLATLATKFHWDPAVAQRELQMINPARILEKVPAFAHALAHRHQPNDWKIVLEQTAALLTDLGNEPSLTIDDYKIIDVPTLLLLGDSDKMVSLDETLTVAKNIPRSQWGVLPATPHPIEQVDINVLASLLRRFYKC